MWLPCFFDTAVRPTRRTRASLRKPLYQSLLACCLAIPFLGILSSGSVGAQSASQPTKRKLEIANRQPALDELGYLPSDGSAPKLNPPSFAWLREPQASTYIVQWSAQPEFEKPTTVSNLWLNCYTHNLPLAPDTYWWRYSYRTRDGRNSNWSQSRRFVITRDAEAFPLPSISERREMLSKQHPRLFLTAADVPELRKLTQASRAAEYKLLYQAAERLCASPPPAEPTARGSATNKKDLQALKDWWPNRERAVLACDQAETLAFVYLLSGERRFGEAARTRVLALADWDPDGPTNFKLNCEAAKPLLHRISRAYDWAYDMFNAEDRAVIRKAVARRIHDAWVSGEVGNGTGHISRPFNSHGNRTWHKIGESGIVFLGEISEAERWLDYALNKYYTCYPVWADDDGGWHEGLSYFAGYMGKVVWWFQASQSAFDIDPFKKPVLGNLADFPLYVAPPHAPNLGFGDLSYRGEIPASWGIFMDYFSRGGASHGAAHSPYWQWWNEQWHLKSADGVLGLLRALSLPAAPTAKAPTDLPVSKVFAGIGVASLHTSLLDSFEDVHLLFKASPRGAASHGHNPQNTFQLNAFGDALLTTCVYRDYHGSDFHRDWVHQTVAHNGVLVNGMGQIPHLASSRGRIIDSKLGKDCDYVAGDAVQAYGGRLKQAIRKLLFAKPNLILVLDELEAPEPARFQFMLHALARFDTEEAKSRAMIQQPHAGALIEYLAQDPVLFRQWDGFNPKPIKGNFANQWHLEAATEDKRTSVEVLTVIVPFRGKTPPRMTCRRLESVHAIGAQVELDGAVWVVGFKKTGAPQTVALAGHEFTEPYLSYKLATQSFRQ